jgi:hypothetical protein
MSDVPSDGYIGHLVRWSSVVALVGQRLRLVEDEHPILNQADAFMFAWALRNTVRAAELCHRGAEGEPHDAIGRALALFHKEVPDCVHIRDVIEHFDAYELGDGKLQRAKKPGLQQLPSEVIIWAAKDPDGVFRLHVSAALALDVRNAQAATEGLFAEVASALDFDPQGC